MNIAITGSCGFIGSHFSERILKKYPEITVYGIDKHLDNYSTEFKTENHTILSKYPNFKKLTQDLQETDLFQKVKIDEVIHFASTPGVRKSLENPIEYVRNNVESFVHLLEECRKSGVKRVIYASSSSVYGNNTAVPYTEDQTLDQIQSSYAVSKRCMEIYAQYYKNVFNLDVVGLRFFTVYGERGRPDMAPYIFLKNIYEGSPVQQHGDGKTSRDYTYVGDIVDGIELIFNNKTISSGIYNLGCSNPISLDEFIQTCENVVGKKAIRNIGDIPKGDVNKTYASIDKAKNNLGFKPKVHLEEGLRQMFLWMLENNRLKPKESQENKP